MRGDVVSEPTDETQGETQGEVKEQDEHAPEAGQVHDDSHPRGPEQEEPVAIAAAEVRTAAAAEQATEPEVPARADRQVRTFIAINMPVAVVRRIVDEVAAIKTAVAAAGHRVAWVPAANVHLTLKFLGPIKAEASEAIVARLTQGLAGRAPFEVEARGLGAFPSVERPRVLWAGVREQPALLALHKDIEGWMEELGFPRETRPYHPHLTVGRVGDGPAGASSSWWFTRAGRWPGARSTTRSGGRGSSDD